jgi:hypothetical protein
VIEEFDISYLENDQQMLLLLNAAILLECPTIGDFIVSIKRASGDLENPQSIFVGYIFETFLGRTFLIGNNFVIGLNENQTLIQCDSGDITPNMFNDVIPFVIVIENNHNLVLDVFSLRVCY